jgi:hypothetical protein
MKISNVHITSLSEDGNHFALGVMKKVIVVFLLFTGIAVANNDKKNPAEYPLTAHVASSNRTGTDARIATRNSNGTYTYGDIDSTDATVVFRIGNLLYTCGFGCRKHVQVGTDVHARLDKRRLYILTDDGQTCDTRIRGVQEIPAPQPQQ